MNNLKVAAICLNQTPLAWEHNQNNIIKGIKQAQKEKVALLCCPELCITGYGCEDMFLAKSTMDSALAMLQNIIPETENIIVALGLPLFYEERLYNAVAVVANRKLLGFAVKQHLANDGVHYEERWFYPWPKGVVEQIKIQKNSKSHDETYPIGDYIFDFGQFKMGFEICEDAWVSPRVGISLAARDVDIILNPSASHFALGKSFIRKSFILGGATLFGVGYIYANLLGNEAGRLIYDGDTIIANSESIIASGPRFSFQDYKLTTAILNIEDLRAIRTKRRQGKLKYQDLENNVSEELDQEQEFKNWENGSSITFEEFSRAMALGLWDYLRKSRAKGFVLNLSGGADSAACACLVAIMLELALQELGFEQFKQKLSFINFEEFKNSEDFKNCEDFEISEKNAAKQIKKSTHATNFRTSKLLSNFLFCLYQKTKNNSETTWQAASLLAESLGCPLAQLDIDNLVDNYCQLIEPILGRRLNWNEDNITLQNIQARVRSPSIWLLANVRQAIVLCPSNRSEAAVGYTTMDGDTSGGLCPLAGIDKTFILRWLKWLESEGVSDIGPIQGLEQINNQEPTAELRPLNEKQTDESDLMPFEWLDTIERLFVLDKLMPLEILKLMQEKYPKETGLTLAKAIDDFFKRWSNNQWKRERFAPAFHSDIHSLDPKTWCRFPILSSGLKKELEEMWKFVS